MSSSNPIVISVQGGDFVENATMVSVIKDCLRERGFPNVATDSGLLGDDRSASEYMLNTQVPHLKNRPFMVEGLADFDFRTPEVNQQTTQFHSDQTFDTSPLFNNLFRM